jgi:hypothetical protein
VAAAQQQHQKEKEQGQEVPAARAARAAPLSEVRGEDVQAVASLGTLGIISPPSSSSSSSSSGRGVILKRGIASRCPPSTLPTTSIAPEATNASALVPPTGFTRIQIADEDSEEEEEEEQEEAKGVAAPEAPGSSAGASGSQGFTRIAIAEDDDDEDSEEEGENTPPHAPPASATNTSTSASSSGVFTKVPIQVCSDSDSEEEAEEEKTDNAHDAPPLVPPSGPSAQELLAEAEAAKTRGNGLMASGQPRDAIAAYSQCISLLDAAAASAPGEQVTALRAAAFNNRAMAHLACKVRRNKPIIYPVLLG